jgi:ligand-binding sensor domain-containing protein
MAARDTNGQLLLLTASGIARAVNGRLTPERVMLPAGMGTVKVSSLTVDREGNLWIGTMGSGLVRARPAPLTAYGKEEGLSDSPFNTVLQDRDGRIWLGGR